MFLKLMFCLARLVNERDEPILSPRTEPVEQLGCRVDTMRGSHAGGFNLTLEQFAAVAELTSAPGRWQTFKWLFYLLRQNSRSRESNPQPSCCEVTDHKEQTSGDFSQKSGAFPPDSFRNLY